MFDKILNANDGSETAFRAFSLALSIAKDNQSELHLICVEEVPYMPDLVQELQELDEGAARRIQAVLQRARALAEKQQVKFHTHTIKGHPVRDIVKLAEDLGADLIVIGAVGHSALYARLIGSRADRIVQLAKCPVLVVK